MRGSSQLKRQIKNALRPVLKPVRDKMRQNVASVINIASVEAAFAKTGNAKEFGTQLANLLERRPQDALDVVNERVAAYAYLAHLGNLIKQFNINFVIDAGAHSGQFASTLYGYSGYKGEVHSFEPVKKYYDEMSKWLYYYPGWKAYNAALGDVSGPSVINLGSNHGGTSSLLGQTDNLKRFAGDAELKGNTQEVMVHRVDELFGEVLDNSANRVFLKLDVQGFERKVLESCGRRLSRCKMIQIEMSAVPLYQSQESVGQLCSYLEAEGFVPIHSCNNFGIRRSIFIDFDFIFVPRHELERMSPTPVEPAEKKSVYSQNNEEEIILDYFHTSPHGTFLDIGAFHPTKFSNTRALYERGFKGVFVEPSPTLKPAFVAAYASDPDIQLLEICVGNKNGVVDFYNSQGDAVSSTVKEETQRWIDSYGVKFEVLQIEMVDVPNLIKRCKYQKFDFINIDTEGNVFEILDQIDPIALGCRLMCIEWASKNKEQYERYFERYGMVKLLENGENLIYARR
jgi:FkbM family methyltransferase